MNAKGRSLIFGEDEEIGWLGVPWEISGNYKLYLFEQQLTSRTGKKKTKAPKIFQRIKYEQTNVKGPQ